MKSTNKMFRALLGGGLILFLSAPLSAQTLGMVVDNTGSVTVFNADDDTVVGSVALPASRANGDCSILPDQSLGFVTTFTNQVHVIDLTGVPILAGGTNPISISNYGEDTSLTPDGACLVVCDGSAIQPVSSIDIASRAEVDTAWLGRDCNSVDVCSDGTVLATSVLTGLIHRLTIDESCMLTDTGDTILTGRPGWSSGPNNVTCAPDAASLVAVQRSPNEVRSFTTPPLAGPVSVQGLSGLSFSGLAAAFSPGGGVLYARSNSAVDAFDYDAGVIGDSRPGFPIAAGRRPTFFGMDQLALHPNGSKLYVPNPGSLDVHDANTGAFITSIVDPAISSPTGVCFQPQLLANVQSVTREVDIDIKPGGDPNSINPRSAGSDPNSINLRSKRVIPVAILTTDTFDASTVDPMSVKFGPGGATEAHGRGHIEDADGDGDLDLVLHFKTQMVGIVCGDTSASLTGQTFDEQAIEGSDSINTVACK